MTTTTTAPRPEAEIERERLDVRARIVALVDAQDCSPEACAEKDRLFDRLSELWQELRRLDLAAR